MERFAAIVPPARANEVIYRGVLAAHAAWRKEVVPKPPVRTPRPKLVRAGTRTNDRALGWADLLWRVFTVDGWRCECGATMQLRTVVIGPPASTRIIDRLVAATGPPVDDGAATTRAA